MSTIESSTSNNVNTKTDISTESGRIIAIDQLVELYSAGFRKLIPLLADSKRANVYDHLILEEEIRAFPLAEGKPVRIIHQNPNFWSEMRLQEKANLFHNVATTFGLTDLNDSKGRALYLYGVDVDSRKAYEALKDLIETLKGITFVVKSHKDYGYHFYILSPVFHKAIGRASFKLGAEVEIKTDLSLGTMHLPPSRHRKYPYWNYKRVSIAEKIYTDDDDTVFQKIINAMSDYLRKEPTEEDIISLDAYPSQSNPSGQQLGLQPSRFLSTEHIEKAVKVILSDSNCYVEHARNDFVYGLSGHLFHNGISETSAIMLVSRLCKEAEDDEVDNRLDVVSETYNKGKIGKPILGISQLRNLIAKYNNENEACVNKIMTVLNESLEITISASSISNVSTTNSNASTSSDSI